MARHGKSFRLSRDKDHHKALFRNLISALILDERVKTTNAKAKALKSLIDRVVNNAKKEGTLTRTRGQLTNYLASKVALDKLYNDIIKRFPDRSSGYARNVRIGERQGDNATMMLVEWVVKSEEKIVKKEKKDE
ncbi:50S ribosomal protein L17 [Candidatus Roizmanbacteria bacterium CG22_combo_CG10-13_8_21_14_all_38_20]|uniref:50S ribosomal protein L17 n=1 Tax=Candidatus Roizmanbacteria bacterium CG22_combo_CG10-13_8_21_14_all_38_20 TaxID=1974862 RepID=A0A2H0BWR7_9BACT|nr:50S ribosomal protein L17 [Candidatus Microgenomates bacterium]PIP62127.1 MAG: 50S ribosomal protein L17 [Candidatus Roizmanbacteria bacterium CG22_combo_CG10-13_8_21_14_all_38_20]PJC31853.1 MAG: 50S ribosomal protein L17 [Candidatus Roizmanbacteria bacterium CG_4_9_14_0_2_um_filter_38_17]